MQKPGQKTGPKKRPGQRKKRRTNPDRRADSRELARMLVSEDPGKRAWLAGVLGSRKNPKNLPLLKILAKDSSPLVRSRAIWAAGAIGGNEAMKLIKNGLKDTALEARLTAETAITELNKRGNKRN
ncbi:MAG: HEAT repeat domain-containing protein [Candidatus ainarchaeum sp.]|nr:HEAT repeat domain-containing protein [Candidatus ainarchaeum sp.]